jgi:hypothetical protein
MCKSVQHCKHEAIGNIQSHCCNIPGWHLRETQRHDVLLECGSLSTLPHL